MCCTKMFRALYLSELWKRFSLAHLVIHGIVVLYKWKPRNETVSMLCSVFWWFEPLHFFALLVDWQWRQMISKLYEFKISFCATKRREWYRRPTSKDIEFEMQSASMEIPSFIFHCLCQLCRKFYLKFHFIVRK